jgi:hypothetical protein
LRDSAKGDTTLPFDLAYAYPTISSLAKFVTQIGTSSDDKGDAKERKVAEMLELIDKYTRDLPAHHGKNIYDPLAGGYVVILTGTTGGLGSSILAGLCASQKVQKVYALNRRSSRDRPLKERQRDALVSRGLDEHVVESEKIILLEGDLTLPDFGVEVAVFREVRTQFFLVLLLK